MNYSEIFLIKKTLIVMWHLNSLCVLMCLIPLMWFTLLMCSYVPYVVHLLIWLNTPYVSLCALCGSNLSHNLPLSSKQRPHHFINFSTLNQFNFKILLINSLVVFRNDDFIKSQFFRFINTLLDTIHRSHLS